MTQVLEEAIKRATPGPWHVDGAPDEPYLYNEDGVNVAYLATDVSAGEPTVNAVLQSMTIDAFGIVAELGDVLKDTLVALMNGNEPDTHRMSMVLNRVQKLGMKLEERLDEVA